MYMYMHVHVCITITVIHVYMYIYNVTIVAHTHTYNVLQCMYICMYNVHADQHIENIILHVQHNLPPEHLAAGCNCSSDEVRDREIDNRISFKLRKGLGRVSE